MVNITQELNTTDGNVTIFAPVNKSYEKLPYKIVEKLQITPKMSAQVRISVEIQSITDMCFGLWNNPSNLS